MRTTWLSMAAALLLTASGAMAQQNENASSASDTATQANIAPAAQGGDIPFLNQVDFGVRGTFYGDGSDEARYQRYRDLRDGGTIDLLRMFKETDKYQLSIRGDHIGYRDQRFYAS